MNPEIKKRVLGIFWHTVTTRQTVRETAEKFGVSKSTVHDDLTRKLPKLFTKGFHEEALNVLDWNKSERHIRGGQATKEKYEKGMVF